MSRSKSYSPKGSPYIYGKYKKLIFEGAENSHDMELLIPKKASMKNIKNKLQKLFDYVFDISGKDGFDIVEESGSRGNVFATAVLENATPDDDWAVLSTKLNDVRVKREVDLVKEFLEEQQGNQDGDNIYGSPECNCCHKCR